MIHVPATGCASSARQRRSASRGLRALCVVLLGMVITAIPLLNGSGVSAWCWVGAPTNFTAAVAPTTGVGRGEVKLAWGPPPPKVDCADEYAIMHSTDGINWSGVVTVSKTTFSFTVGGLSHGVLHRFRVAGVETFTHTGPGDWSEVQVTTPVWAPIAPGGLTAAAAPAAGVGADQVKLSWSAPADDGGKAITDYVVQRSSDGGTTWTTVPDGTSTTTTLVVSGLTTGTKYSFHVAAKNGVGAGAWSSAATATPAWWPDAPGGLKASSAPEPGVGSGQVKLTWTAPASTGGTLTDYLVELSTDGKTWATVQDTLTPTAGFTVSGLTNGTNYQFRVTAVNSAGLTSTPATASATPMWRPDAPIGLTATVAPTDGLGSGEVKLSWTAPPSNGSPITDYHIERSYQSPSWIVVDDGVSTATTYTVRGLTNNHNWSFQVWAKNAVGSSVGSVVVQATPVAEPTIAPSGLTASVAPSPGAGSGEVKLKWDAAAPSGAGVTDYVIESSTDGTTWTRVDDGVSTATEATVGGLINGTPYWLRVAAANKFGAGPASAAERATPVWLAAAPDEVTAAVAPSEGVGSGEVQLSWPAAADNGVPITDYMIEWSVDGDTWTAVDDGVSTDTAFTVGRLTDGTAYDFRVAAVNALGQGQWSVQTPATPVWIPAVVDGLAAAVAPADGVGSGQVQLTWAAPSDHGSPITDYVIESSTDGSTWTPVDDGISTATTHTVGGLTDGARYDFRVAAVNAVGASRTSEPVQATPVWMPDAPDGLIPSVAPSAAVGSRQVELSWAAPADHGAVITDYLVQRSTDGANWTTIDDGVSTARSYTVSRLTNGTTYGFRVAAVNGLGQGAWSAPIQATPRWKPTAPADLRAASPASRQVRLTWKAPSSSNGSPVTDYVIQRSTASTAWATVRDGVSTARSYTVTRLTNGVRYRFRVAAKNAVGVGPWSAAVRATPHAR